MLLKKGSTGEDVKKIQSLLGCTADGIFGNDTERLVKEWQKNNGLDVDGIVGNKTWNAMFPSEQSELDIVYNPINVHITRANRKIKYLVIHYTAGRKSTPGSAVNTRNVFLRRAASADFCVDDTTIIQVNPDLNKYYCWAVGDGNGKYGITNTNSISIEMCSTLDDGADSHKSNHVGWHITDDVFNNTVKLAKYLMKKYDISVDRVVRHYDASRKLCPGVIGWNDGPLYDSRTGKKLSQKNNSDVWLKFKNLIAQ